MITGLVFFHSYYPTPLQFDSSYYSIITYIPLTPAGRLYQVIDQSNYSNYFTSSFKVYDGRNLWPEVERVEDSEYSLWCYHFREEHRMLYHNTYSSGSQVEMF